MFLGPWFHGSVKKKVLHSIIAETVTRGHDIIDTLDDVAYLRPEKL